MSWAAIFVIIIIIIIPKPDVKTVIQEGQERVIVSLILSLKPAIISCIYCSLLKKKKKMSPLRHHISCARQLLGRRGHLHHHSCPAVDAEGLVRMICGFLTSCGVKQNPSQHRILPEIFRCARASTKSGSSVSLYTLAPRIPELFVSDCDLIWNGV